MGTVIDVELRILSHQREGLLSALGEVLIANHFSLLRQRRSTVEAGVMAVLVVQGPQQNLESLRQQLGSHACVQSLESEAYDPATQSCEQTNKQAYDQRRIEALLPSLAAQYPNISGPLIALSRELVPEQRESILRYLGMRVGAWVYKRDFALGARLPKPSLARKIGLPALRQLLPAELEGSFFHTVHSPFASAHTGVSTPQCHFLRGFMEGVLSEACDQGRVRVTEVACRAIGSDCCKFVVHS